MNSALPEMALFCGTNSLRLTLLQAPHCTESCLQIFASPKAGFWPRCFLAPKAFLKAASLSVWVSYHLSWPVTVFLSCSLCPFDLLKMSFSVLLMKMKLNLGSRAGEAGARARMYCLRPWLGCLPD